jgi:hypothetical protein
MDRTPVPAHSAHYDPRLPKPSTAGIARPHRPGARIPQSREARPNAAPAYYQGRPAALVIAAMRPRRGRVTSAAAPAAPVAA